MTSAEVTIQPPKIESKEHEAKPSLHIYIPGIMGTDQGMSAIYKEVESSIKENYPGSVFEGKNSYISPDTLKLPDRDRHILLARKVVQALKDGQDVHLYGHSLGAVEVATVLGLVKKMRPDLRDNHPDLQKLHLVLMSPAGFGKDFLQSIQMIGRLKNIVTAGAESSGHIYGLETIGYLPLKAEGSTKDEAKFIPLDQQAQIMTDMLRDKSQRGQFGDDAEAGKSEGILQSQASEVLEKRFGRLTDAEKTQLREIDDALIFYGKRGNGPEFQGYLKRRGQLLSKYAQQTYDGLPLEPKDESVAATPDTEQDTEVVDAETEKATWRLYAQAILGSLSLIGGIISGRTYREIKPLSDAGVDVSFLVPEFDVLIKMKEISDFLGKDKVDKAQRLETSTHSNSSFTPRMLAEAFTRIASRR